jgi:hypothetical protein
MNKLFAEDYLAKIIERLKGEGFFIVKKVSYSGTAFEYIAKRTRFKMERGGFFTTFLIFSLFKNPAFDLLREFSTKSFHFADRASGIHPPRGLFYSINCFPVAVTDYIDNSTINVIRNSDFPKHWCGSEKLVVFSKEYNALYYSEKTPAWGSMYHDWDRQFIKKILAP